MRAAKRKAGLRRWRQHAPHASRASLGAYGDDEGQAGHLGSQSALSGEDHNGVPVLWTVALSCSARSSEARKTKEVVEPYSDARRREGVVL
ncbi:hypothetical protein MRX96_048410 [Rhipicephalus microplus]